MRDPRWYPRGLYIHIPFCEAICAYCDFAREIRQADRIRRYLNALETELARKVRALNTVRAPVTAQEEGNAKQAREPFVVTAFPIAPANAAEVYAPRTVFVGGGTPSALSADELEHLFALLHRQVDLSKVAEFTIEANPNSIDEEKLGVMRQHGVNRISIGVQSFQPHLLKILGRIHSAEEGREAVAAARQAGFERISIDLMHGVPSQTLDDLKRDLDAALALELNHLSAYGLTYEEGTPLKQAVETGRQTRLGEEQEAALYAAVMDQLEAGGLNQYEISNYARPGCEAQHNLLYWRNQAYLGVGLSAAHYVSGERSVNRRALEAYLDAIESGQSAVESSECLAPEARAREALMLALRLREGVDPQAFRARWGFDLVRRCEATLNTFLEHGLMERLADGRLRISRKGLLVANGILREFL